MVSKFSLVRSRSALERTCGCSKLRKLRKASDFRATAILSFPKIISGRIGDAALPRSEWRQWCQIVGLLDARVHLSVMPSECASDCNTPHTKQAPAAGATHQRLVCGPGTRAVRCRSIVPQCHFATVTWVRSGDRECPSPLPGT